MDCNSMFMGPDNVMSTMVDINADWRRGPVIGAAKAIGKEQVPTSTVLKRRTDGHKWNPPYVPHPNGQLILGQGNIAWNNNYVAPQSPPAPALVSPPVTPAQAATLQQFGAPKIGRPPNSWIIYRSDKQADVKLNNPRKKNNEICKYLSRT